MKPEETEGNQLTKKATIGVIAKKAHLDRFQTLFDALDEKHYNTSVYENWESFLECNERFNVPKLVYADIKLFEHLDFNLWQAIHEKLKRSDGRIVVMGDFNKKSLINITALQDGRILDFVFFPADKNHLARLNMLYSY